MYRVVIAEDEQIIREGISRLVDWAEFDCEVCFLAVDGLQALQYIRENPVDVLLTDIKMPRMDGLDLIKHAREIDERIVSFIISGYGDFEYAKTAISYNVAGYLMKPLEEEQLQEMLTKACGILGKDRSHEYALLKSQQENKRLARERVFSRTVYSETPMDLSKFGRDLIESADLRPGLFYCACLVGAVGERERVFGEALRDDPGHIVTVRIQPDIWLVVLVGETPERITVEHLETFRAELMPGRAKKNGLSVGEGAVWQDLEGLRKSFKEAVINFNLKLSASCFCGGEQEKAAEINLKKQCDEIVTMVIHQREDLDKYLEQVEEQLLQTGPQCIENVNILISSVYGQLINALMSRENMIASEKLTKVYEDYERAKNSIEIRRKFQNMRELLADISALFVVSSQGKWAEEIGRALAYIERNYYKGTMDVAEIADHVGMNPRYFSAVFKEKVGKGVAKYLIEHRIKVAKQLLLDKDLKAYEVAEMVGYESYPYFSTLFRKATGESPESYSKRMRGLGV